MLKKKHTLLLAVHHLYIRLVQFKHQIESEPDFNFGEVLPVDRHVQIRHQG